MSSADIFSKMSSNNSGQNNTPNSSNNNDSTQSNSANPFISQAELDYLKSIDNTLKDILKYSRSTSQSDAKYAMPRRDDFRQSKTSSRWSPIDDRRYSRGRSRRSSNSNEGFIDGFQSAIVEAFLGSDFKDKIKSSLDDFADLVGVDLKDVPNTLGKELGKQVSSAFKQSSMGKQVFGAFDSAKNSAAGWVKAKFSQGVDNYNKAHGTNYSFNTNSQSAKTKEAADSVTKDASNKVASNTEELNRQFSELSAQSISIVADTVTISRTKGKNKGETDKSDADIQDASLSDVQSSSLSESSQSDPSVVDGQRTSITESSSQKVPDLSNLINEPMNEVQNLLQGKFGNLFNSIDDKFGSLLKDSPLGSIKDKLLGKLGGGAAQSTAIEAVNSSASTSIMAAESMQAGAAEVLASGSGAGAALEGLATAAGAALPPLLLVAAAFIALTVVIDALSPAIEGAGKLFDAMKDAGNRYTASQKKKLEESQKRLKADIESMIKEPFSILEEAAHNVYDAWDKNVRLINGTQGYTKSDLQDLMSVYSQRLRSEGLTSVISTSDITENLAKVLEAGLSGKAAEEFAYQATKLSAEVPSQDFFGYADTYASVAANAIRSGASQSEAIQYANAQLESFASNVLYANRNLAGGITTGLKDAEHLFDQATQIAQAAKTNNSSEISGVLTSVAAITGSIAPDLTDSITDAIYKAATGGNSSDLVALRSLAKTGASNSDFLKAFASDPKFVMSTLFRNLSTLQNMSDTNSMEVAEALSGLFGISMDAFSRVDFNYLASAISQMDVNNTSLDENLKLLRSGQTTATAEQLRMAQINEYLIDEGLAYVLDNEVARSIQEHMWDEQFALQMQETTYGVELQGAALEFLEGIREAIDNVINLLNPFSWGKKLANLIGSVQEVSAQDSDIRQLLELGKVGKGNQRSFYQLTTRGADLNLTKSMLTLMGGSSSYEMASANRKMMSNMFDAFTGNFLNNLSNARDSYSGLVASSLTSNIAQATDINSLYNWGIVGKSTANLLLGDKSSLNNTTLPKYTGKSSSTDAAQSEVTAKIEQMLSDSYLQTKFIDAGKSYQDWADSAKNFGINDIGKALEDAGYSEVQVQSYFQQKEVEQGNAIQEARYEDEQDFRDKGRQFWIDEAEYTLQIIDLVTNTNTKLDTIIEQFVEFHSKWDVFRKDFTWKQFYSDWTDYFINHTVYNKSYDYNAVDKIFRDEKKSSEDAIYALAEAFKNTTSDLKDPTVQTNALLSQILLVVNAIMQQNNKVSTNGLSLTDTLSSLAMGLVKET